MSALGFLRRGGAVRVSLVVLSLVAVAGLFGPLLAPYDPLAQNTPEALAGPSLTNMLGTD